MVTLPPISAFLSLRNGVTFLIAMDLISPPKHSQGIIFCGVTRFAIGMDTSILFIGVSYLVAEIYGVPGKRHAPLSIKLSLPLGIISPGAE